MISTAGASANGTASGFSIRSLTQASCSSSRVKNFCRSSFISHASKLSMVWYEVSEISWSRQFQFACKQMSTYTKQKSFQLGIVVDTGIRDAVHP